MPVKHEPITISKETVDYYNLIYHCCTSVVGRMDLNMCGIRSKIQCGLDDKSDISQRQR